MSDISLFRTWREAWAFPVAGVRCAPLGLILFVIASALLSYGATHLVGKRFGAGWGLLLAWICATAMWAVWQGQLAAAVGSTRRWPRFGAGERSVFLSMLAFACVMGFALVLAFAVAGFFAGSVLAALEIDPEGLDWSVASWADTQAQLGQAGTAAVVLSVVLAGLVPLALLVRTAPFRPLALERGRFVVFEPGGWTRGRTWVLIGASLLSFVPAGLGALALLMATNFHEGFGDRILMFALASLPSLVFFGFCQSVLRQTRPEA